MLSPPTGEDRAPELFVVAPNLLSEMQSLNESLEARARLVDEDRSRVLKAKLELENQVGAKDLELSRLENLAASQEEDLQKLRKSLVSLEMDLMRTKVDTGL